MIEWPNERPQHQVLLGRGWQHLASMHLCEDPSHVSLPSSEREKDSRRGCGPKAGVLVGTGAQATNPGLLEAQLQLPEPPTPGAKKPGP